MRATKLAACGLLGVLGATSLDAYGAWVVQPSVDLRGEYDSNVRLSEDQDEDAIVSSAAVQAEVRSVTEVSEMSAVAGFNYLNYAGYSGTGNLDNRDNEFLSLSGRRTMERSAFGIDGRLRRDDLFRRVLVIEDPAGGLIDPGDDVGGSTDDGLVVNDPNDVNVDTVGDQVRRFVVNVSPYYEVTLDPVTSARFGYTYFQSKLESDQPIVGISDSKSNGVNVNLSRALSELTGVSLELRASRFEPDEGLESKLYEGIVGWSHQFSEILRGDVEIGAVRTENGLSDDTSLLLKLRGQREALSGRDVIEYQRSVVPDSFGNLVEADRVSLRVQRALSPRWNVEVRGRGLRSNSLLAGRNDRDYLEAGAELRWAMTPALSIGGGYRYRWVDRKDSPGTAQGHGVTLSLQYRPPRAIR